MMEDVKNIELMNSMVNNTNNTYHSYRPQFKMKLNRNKRRFNYVTGFSPRDRRFNYPHFHWYPNNIRSSYKKSHKKSARKLPSRPSSPLLGTEEHRLKKIQETSELIKKRLLSGDDTSIPLNSACSEEPNCEENVSSNKSGNNCVEKMPANAKKFSEKITKADINSTSGVQNEKSNLKENKIQKNSFNVEEIMSKIMNHITNLNYGRKINLINSGFSSYDTVIQQIHKQRRLELSRALRTMCSSADFGLKLDNFSRALIENPDIGIDLEDLPREVIEQLSLTLNFNDEEQDIFGEILNAALPSERIPDKMSVDEINNVPSSSNVAISTNVMNEMLNNSEKDIVKNCREMDVNSSVKCDENVTNVIRKIKSESECANELDHVDVLISNDVNIKNETLDSLQEVDENKFSSENFEKDVSLVDQNVNFISFSDEKFQDSYSSNSKNDSKCVNEQNNDCSDGMISDDMNMKNEVVNNLHEVDGSGLTLVNSDDVVRQVDQNVNFTSFHDEKLQDSRPLNLNSKKEDEPTLETMQTDCQKDTNDDCVVVESEPVEVIEIDDDPQENSIHATKQNGNGETSDNMSDNQNHNNRATYDTDMNKNNRFTNPFEIFQNFSSNQNPINLYEALQKFSADLNNQIAQQVMYHIEQAKCKNVSTASTQTSLSIYNEHPKDLNEAISTMFEIDLEIENLTRIRKQLFINLNRNNTDRSSSINNSTENEKEPTSEVHSTCEEKTKKQENVSDKVIQLADSSINISKIIRNPDKELKKLANKFMQSKAFNSKDHSASSSAQKEIKSTTFVSPDLFNSSHTNFKDSSSGDWKNDKSINNNSNNRNIFATNNTVRSSFGSLTSPPLNSSLKVVNEPKTSIASHLAPFPSITAPNKGSGLRATNTSTCSSKPFSFLSMGFNTAGASFQNSSTTTTAPVNSHVMHTLSAVPFTNSSLGSMNNPSVGNNISSFFKSESETNKVPLLPIPNNSFPRIGLSDHGTSGNVGLRPVSAATVQGSSFERTRTVQTTNSNSLFGRCDLSTSKIPYVTKKKNEKEPGIDLPKLDSKILAVIAHGNRILAGSESGQIFAISLNTGQLIKSVKVSNHPVTCLCLPKVDACLSLCVGTHDKGLHVYDSNSYRLNHYVPLGDSIQCMDKEWGYLFLGCQMGKLYRYYLAKNKIDFEDTISNSSILVLKATQEGARRVLLVGTRNAPLCIRDAMSGLHMRTVAQVIAPTVYSLVLNRGMIYCGTTSHDILIYSFYDGELEDKLTVTNSKGIGCMKIIENVLFASCYDGNVYIFHTNPRRFLGKISGPGGIILSMEVVKNKIFLGTINSEFTMVRVPPSISKWYIK